MELTTLVKTCLKSVLEPRWGMLDELLSFSAHLITQGQILAVSSERPNG